MSDNFIEDYAKLLNMRESFEQQRKPLPKNIQNQITNLEFRASQMLTPNQISDAMVHVQTSQAEQRQATMQTEQLRDWRYDRVKQDRGFERSTKGAMSAEQLASAYNDGKYVQKNPAKMDVKALDEHCRKTFGYSLKKREDNLEHLHNVSLRGDDARTEALAEQYKITPDALAKYDKEGFNYHWQKHLDEQNKNDPDEYEVEVDERSMLGVDLRVAMSQAGEEIYDTGIIEEYRSDEGMRGDLCAAWEKSDDLEINNELDGVNNNG